MSSSPPSPQQSAQSGSSLAVLGTIGIAVVGVLVLALVRAGDPEAVDDPGGSADEQASRRDPNPQPHPARVDPAVRQDDRAEDPHWTEPKQLGPPPETPPAFGSRAEEIAWDEKRLATSKRELDARLRAHARMFALREKALQAHDPELNLREWEAALIRLENNIERARKSITWYERKLVEINEDR